MATVTDHPSLIGTALDRHASTRPTTDVIVLRRFASVAAKVVVILAICAALTLAIAAVTGASGSWRMQPVLTGSMEPSIGRGSLAITRPVKSTSVQVGDVIVVGPPDMQPVLHRVVDVIDTDDGVVVMTQGDANPTPDRWGATTLPEKVWRLDTSIPFAGRIWIALNEPLMRALIVGISVWAFLVAARRKEEVAL